MWCINRGMSDQPDLLTLVKFESRGPSSDFKQGWLKRSCYMSKKTNLVLCLFSTLLAITWLDWFRWIENKIKLTFSIIDIPHISLTQKAKCCNNGASFVYLFGHFVSAQISIMLLSWIKGRVNIWRVNHGFQVSIENSIHDRKGVKAEIGFCTFNAQQSLSVHKTTSTQPP